MWDLIVSVPDHCLSFYFMKRFEARRKKGGLKNFGTKIDFHVVSLSINSIKNDD